MRKFIIQNVAQLRTSLALTRRNLSMILKESKDICIDGILLATLNVLLFAYLFPAMGMATELIIPVFIGSLMALFINLSFSISIRTVFDLRFKRFIDYLLTLPLTTAWLFACQVAGFFLELLFSTVPIITLSMWALSGYISFAQTQWPLLIALYIMSLLLLSISFLTFAIYYPYAWFLDNMWPRILSPLVAMGCVYVPWYRVYEISPMIARLMLINPLTYMSEGIRASLLGPSGYLDPRICLVVLVCSMSISVVFLSRAIKQKLNPV